MHQPAHHRRFHHHQAIGGYRPPRPSPIIAPLPGQVSFRVLCSVFAVGGIIGESGATVSQLQRETATRIQCLENVPGCEEKVVVIVGSGALEKEMIIVNGEDEIYGAKFEVSSAQEALFRVLEMIWEKEVKIGVAAEGGEVRCRLLADTTQVRAVLGKGGKNIERMRNESGAKIRILTAPVCAAMNDEMIQLSGDILAIKKALFIVSCCLQECPPMNRPQTLLNRPLEEALIEDSSDPHAEFFPHLVSSLPKNLEHHASNDHSLAMGADKIPSQETGCMQQEVVFRLLCSNLQAGGVIGRKGAGVRALQNETGASIMFATAITGWDGRVITISSLENLEAGYSPAQNAVLRVFARCIEVDVEREPLSSFNLETNVTARLLVSSDHADCLRSDKGRIVSEINERTSTDVQILREDEFLKFASEDDVVVQITGEYKNVQNALFQVTGRLRDALLPSEVLSEVRTGSYPFFLTPSINPNGRREAVFPDFDQDSTLVQRMGHLGLSHRMSGPSPRLHHLQIGGRGNLRASAGRGLGFTYPGGDLEIGSANKPFTVQKTTMEVKVSESVFSSVFCADGGNLERMKQISGATVELRDPDPAGKNEGTIIISGTPNQTLAAQSLLQAFLLKG